MSTQGIRRTYIRGEIIFRQGENGHVMYFITSGAIKITQVVRGKDKDLAILQKGSFFGELAIFTNRPRSATVTAVEDCELIEVDANQLDSFLDERPETSRSMLKILAERLRETDDLLENLRLDDADSRVCNALLQAAEEQGQAFSSVDINIDVDSLVVKTTLSRDEVKKILGKLKNLNLIQIFQKTIHIPSLDILRGYKSFLGMRLGYKDDVMLK